MRWTAARLAPVSTAAIGAEARGHSLSTARNAGGVLPESRAISASARSVQASISSRCRIAVRLAVSTRPRSGPLEVAEVADLAVLTLERFAPLTGSAFSVDIGSPWNLRLELAEVAALSPQTSLTGAFRAPFRLIFHGPAQPVHPQATLPLLHPELGRIEMFLVPIGPDAIGMRYEAIFT